MSTTERKNMKDSKDTAQATTASPLVGTEREFFESRREALRIDYEREVQEKVVRWEASSEAVLALTRKRYRKVRLVTSFGTIVLKCRRGIAPKAGWTCPALLHLGIRKNQHYSPDIERRMAVLAVETGSYEKAARVADNAAWLCASDGAVHSTIARLGKMAEATPPREACRGAAGPEDTLILMADGWNARHRGVNWGVDTKNRDLPERVHWNEIRSAVIFKLSALLAVSGKRKALMEKHAVSVPAETSPYDFGIHLHREALRMGLMKAKAVFFVMDGGVWLWNLYKDRFEKCSKATLDFYHLSQHLHALSAALHGPDTEKSRIWCGRILHELKHKSSKRLFRTLDELLREPPSDDSAAEAIRLQNAYFRNHAEHMDYAANAKLGVPIGSGSIESLCSQFQNRLKRTGQFWTKEGFAALLRVVVLYWNNELDSLWQAPAAA
jgi:hypothetical protein